LKGAIDMADWDAPGYTKLKDLGSGGFGDVVLARHDGSGTLVAIKYLRRHLLADAEFVEMFRGEASVLSSLDDPNVVRLYEYLESPSGAAIVMELVDGVSLREILRHQGATTAEAALVVLQGSLLGLAAAHQRGVVHRDYKPENVLVNGDGVSKLTDFGIAARAGDRPPPAGTLVYAPPEQFAGTPASPAGDVYAATATFYECMAGRPPFIADTAEALLYQHLSQPVPLDPVPEPLRPLVIAGMAKEPRDRPTDGTSFVTALNAIAAGTYGPDWEERGRSHLGEAALLLALLWPSGASPATQGLAVEHVHLSPASPSSQASAAAQASEAGEVHHLWHLRHLRHLLHLQHLRNQGDRRRRRVRPGKAVVGAAAAIVVVAAASALAVGLNRSSDGHGHLIAQSGSTSGSQGSSSPSSTLPAVTGTSPASGTTGGGTLVTITGNRLDGPVTVKFGAKAGTITVDLNAKIMVKSPPGQGVVEITVTTPDGTGKAGEFSYHSPSAQMAAPAVTGVSPATGSAAGGTLVTINGTNLADATMVSFGGVAGMISSDSGTQITVDSPPGQGTADVLVTTPGGTASAGIFTYRNTTAPPPHLGVTGISPASGPGDGGTPVTITGTGLSGASGVSFGGAAGMITADSGTQITVDSPPGKGTVSVAVTTPGGTATAGTFTYHASSQPPPPRPVVTGISPASGPAAGGTSVTITGTNLSGATGVSFGGAGGSITADSSTKITATSPAGSGTVNITATTKGGTSATTGGDKFTYVTPAPTVTGISPASGPAAGGTSVTITGTNLSGATGVSFGGAGGSITADSSTKITATSPAGSGAVNITATTKGGTSATTGGDKFTYVTPAPTVTRVDPDSGPVAGGTSVTITGTNLSGATSVSFGGVGARISSDASTQIVVTAPEGKGTVNVTVTTPGGSASGEFTYVTPAPAVTAISPSSGTIEGGMTVTITGSNLSGATSVSFGGVGARISSDSSTQITVVSPSGKGTVYLTVTTAAGTSAATAACEYTYQVPVIQ
jgi:serine/threonine protein kinase